MKKRAFLILLLFLFLISCNRKNLVNVLISESDCNKNWALCLIFTNNEYSIQQYKKQIKIAVLDSGINDNHYALEGQIIKKYNAITKTDDTQDNFGHGTTIASIIAAKPNDDIIQGINPFVEIYDVKVIDDKGGGQVAHVIDGIKWSIDNKVDIINISFGFKHDIPELKEIVDKAIKKDIVVVASAGNNYGLGVDYPARYDNVISVGSIDKDIKVSEFNSKGKVNIYAPGEDVIVLTSKGNSTFESGSSLATAYVTGVLSVNNDILKSINQEKENHEIIILNH